MQSKAGIQSYVTVQFTCRICSACPFLLRVFSEHAPKGVRLRRHITLALLLSPEAAGLSKTQPMFQMVKCFHLLRV